MSSSRRAVPRLDRSATVWIASCMRNAWSPSLPRGPARPYLGAVFIGADHHEEGRVTPTPFHGPLLKALFGTMYGHTANRVHGLFCDSALVTRADAVIRLVVDVDTDTKSVRPDKIPVALEFARGSEGGVRVPLSQPLDLTTLPRELRLSVERSWLGRARDWFFGRGVKDGDIDVMRLRTLFGFVACVEVSPVLRTRKPGEMPRIGGAIPLHIEVRFGWDGETGGLVLYEAKGLSPSRDGSVVTLGHLASYIEYVNSSKRPPVKKKP